VDELTYFETWDPNRPRCRDCGHVWADHRKRGEYRRSPQWEGCIEIVPVEDGDYENCYCENPPPLAGSSPLSDAPKEHQP